MPALVDVGEATGVLAPTVGAPLLVVVTLTLGDGAGVPDAVVVGGTVDGALAPEPLFMTTV